MGISDAELIEMAYRAILGRAPDLGSKERWAERLRNEPKSRLIASLVASPEFYRNYLHGLVQKGGMSAVTAICNRIVLSYIIQPLFKLRCELVSHHLPRVSNVLDLGGAFDNEQGGLLTMGYRGADTITIVDLPPEIRFKPAMERHQESVHHGVTVKYAYHSMADLDRYPSEAFDFVWSGQTIEHVSVADADKIMRQMHRILKPGGTFALDTPNRALTRLAVGDEGFIHAEHAHEYGFEEFIERHADCGLKLVETRGLMNLPRSLKAGYMLPDEAAEGHINDTPETSYVFFLKYMKS